MGATMRAMRYERYGGPEQLREVELPVPQPGRGQVRIRVAAAALNAADWRMMRAEPALVRLATGLRRPRVGIPGSDVVGVVDAVGEGCELVAVGDRVLGRVDLGGCAEYVLAKEQHVATVPESIDDACGAALGMAATTALHGLRAVGELEPGSRVLVHGAAGGIGHVLVQLACARGARVTGVCSSGNVEFVRGLGAAEVVDYTREDLLARDDRYHAVLDVVGNHPVRAMARLLEPGGTYVDFGGIAGRGRVLGPAAHQLRTALAGPFVRGRRLRVVAEPRTRELIAAVLDHAMRGELVPHVSRTFDLGDTAEALAHLATGHARGKVVVRVSSSAGAGA